MSECAVEYASGVCECASGVRCVECVERARVCVQISLLPFFMIISESLSPIQQSFTKVICK